ncbi:MOSC domain-containing protein [Geodermatophilus obscurus]|uniref:MOSC domain protein beta barrel domain protein n=1 Tax=Geodermatophilus obscurus (strain ATCC 25078 / DSM 43160 / JCM 3152 / CCUG 61914 / KCC A-0152 / KCTC 9177 / NBRC 13315 / NRRL B-3577 / G-20) TaxID=526225 RepID=D2SGH4_GEOOG|nr:MOSC N-terminal beta barrel domain-containing protein [Geodermatophilus obscurus]ADB72856.1 MOSC domain protein beta barrel domain protein [Geodermatophilus obscurus DSM 43160]
MRVAELWRYPVKSLQGERLTTVHVGPEGLAGDRQWALFDAPTGYGLTARRVPDLLFLSGRLRADGHVEVVLPDGTVTSDDAVLSDWLGRSVALRAAADAPGERLYENPNEVSAAGEYDWDAFPGARGAFHDSSRTRVSLVSTGTLGTWDRRRFRANVVLDGAGEDALIGQQVRLGGAELDVVKPVDRCVMVTRPQPGGIGRDNGVLKTIHRERDGCLAIGALVARTGTVAVGDELTA